VLIKLPAVWIVALNCGGWFVIQWGMAWVFTRMPEDWFRPGAARKWEQGGALYERVFGIRKWKDMIPDAARWLSGGFAKASLNARERDYFARFIRETWRGELCHWAAMCWTPLFFVWNPPWGDVVIVVYAVAANMPCILVQRYNRIRLARVLSAREGHQSTG